MEKENQQELIPNVMHPKSEGRKSKKLDEVEMPIDYFTFFSNEYQGYDGYAIKLYRRKRHPNGRPKRTFLAVYYDAPPEEVSIAEEWGTGDFTAQSVDPVTKQFHSKDFSIDEALDYLYKPKHSTPVVHTGLIPPLGGAPPPDTMGQLKTIMEAVVTPILEIVKSNGKGNSNTKDLSIVQELMTSLTTGFSKMNNQLVNQQVENMKRINIPQDVEAVEDQHDWTWIVTMIKMFGAKMFDKNGKLTSTAQNTIETNPAFNEALEDQSKLDSLYFTLAKDPSIGKEKADSMFQGVGVQTLTEEAYQEAIK